VLSSVVKQQLGAAYPTVTCGDALLYEEGADLEPEEVAAYAANAKKVRNCPGALVHWGYTPGAAQGLSSTCGRARVLPRGSDALEVYPGCCWGALVHWGYTPGAAQGLWSTGGRPRVQAVQGAGGMEDFRCL